MRRTDREVKDFERVLEIVARCDVLRLGLSDGEVPYIVPVNFGYEATDGQLFFYIHGAMAGKKYELLRRTASCAFEMDCGHKLEYLAEERNATMRYQCVMGRAQVELLEGSDKERAMDCLMGRYEETRAADYPREVLERTMLARLRVTEWSAKVNLSRAG